MLARAFNTFHATKDRPTMIIVDSHIAYGSPHKQDSSAAHGEPLGEEEVRLTKQNYGWPPDAKFLIPDGVYDHFRETSAPGANGYTTSGWRSSRNTRRSILNWPTICTRCSTGNCRKDGTKTFRLFQPIRKGSPDAMRLQKWKTRSLRTCHGSLAALRTLRHRRRQGSSSTAPAIFPLHTPDGRNFHFGIREHAMSSILNGLCCREVRPFGSGFLIFSDYARPAIRLSALMEFRSFIFSRMTRSESGRRADASTGGTAGIAASRSRSHHVAPGGCERSRRGLARHYQAETSTRLPGVNPQPLPFDRTRFASAAGVARGAYVMADAKRGKPAVILIGTGSEVALCAEAYEALTQEGIGARVVSMPSWELEQAGSGLSRQRSAARNHGARVGRRGFGNRLGSLTLACKCRKLGGTHTFGSSAPIKDLMTRLGFTPEKVLTVAKEQIAKSRGRRREIR